MKFPTITIQQPWASLLAAGVKRYETRGWNPFHDETPSVGFGVLLIHAARSRDNIGIRHEVAYRDALALAGFGESEWLPTAAIIGAVEFVAIHRADIVGVALRSQAAGETAFRRSGEDVEQVAARELSLGNFSANRWAWEFRRPRVFETPIPYRGAQGVWSAELSALPPEKANRQ
ncbi:MAG: hypothetical protein NT069_32460 [Planctomycetota bacterium]|nr:hypothetical protein [Planctomycetota bacterium]